jgi:uncharacterized protein with HEPN domain
MPRSLRLYLSDVQSAIKDIEMFTAGKTLEDYLESELLRAAVERKFSIIGEAMAQARRHYPEVTLRIEHVREVIDFRNLLMHNYLLVDDKLVWGVVEGSLAPFGREVDRWAHELDSLTQTVA